MENIRITSGNLRGRIIRSPKSESTHPMGAREKLALFNMISAWLPEAEVLDAFAGSGALGIEAISRGAKKATFIEKNPKAAGVIRENLASLGIEGEVIAKEAGKFESAKMFDIVIADPPYNNFKLKEVAELVKFLNHGGVFVLSHPEKAPEIKGITCFKTRQYANAHLSIYLKH